MGSGSPGFGEQKIIGERESTPFSSLNWTYSVSQLLSSPLIGADGFNVSYNMDADAEEAALDFPLSLIARHSSKSSIDCTRGTSEFAPSSSVMSTSSPGAVGMCGSLDEDESTADVSADSASSFNFATVEV